MNLIQRYKNKKLGNKHLKLFFTNFKKIYLHFLKKKKENKFKKKIIKDRKYFFFFVIEIKEFYFFFLLIFLFDKKENRLKFLIKNFINEIKKKSILSIYKKYCESLNNIYSEEIL